MLSSQDKALLVNFFIKTQNRQVKLSVPIIQEALYLKHLLQSWTSWNMMLTHNRHGKAWSAHGKSSARGISRWTFFFFMEVQCDLLSFSKDIRIKFNICQNWNQLILQHVRILQIRFSRNWKMMRHEFLIVMWTDQTHFY